MFCCRTARGEARNHIRCHVIAVWIALRINYVCEELGQPLLRLYRFPPSNKPLKLVNMYYFKALIHICGSVSHYFFSMCIIRCNIVLAQPLRIYLLIKMSTICVFFPADSVHPVDTCTSNSLSELETDIKVFKDTLLKILDEEEIIEELCLTKWTDPRVL